MIVITCPIYRLQRFKPNLLFHEALLLKTAKTVLKCIKATKICLIDSLQINLSALMLIDILCTVLVISTTAMPIHHESVS